MASTTSAQCDGCGDTIAHDRLFCAPCLDLFEREHDAISRGAANDALAAHYRLRNLYTVCCARARTQARYAPLAAALATALERSARAVRAAPRPAAKRTARER